MLELAYEDERVAFFVEDRLFICGFRDAPTMKQMRAVSDVARPLEAKRGRLALLNVAFVGRPRFSEEVRKVSVEYTRDPTLFGLARAHVVLMTGLAGAAVLAFVNTFVLLGRPPRPTRVAGSIEAAAQWLAPMLEWPTERIEDAAARVRDHVLPDAG